MQKAPQVNAEKHPNVSIFQLDEEFVREASEISQSSNNSVPEFWKRRYEAENAKNWDTFYKHNRANFFKDRHYITEEFNLASQLRDSSEGFHVVDMGCGVGNAIVPLLLQFPNASATCFDCSETAVKLLREKLVEEHLENRCKVSVGDLMDPAFDAEGLENIGEFALLFFVQSAIDPIHYERIQALAWKLLKPGGAVLFRDYGKYDMAQIRFEKSSTRQGNRLSEDFYVRGDGTRAKFFTEEELKAIWERNGKFRTEEFVLHTKKIVNRKTGVEMKRVWIQAKWIRV
jgi:tRNAThr (cytosine32-N3)-methyltransferase